MISAPPRAHWAISARTTSRASCLAAMGTLSSRSRMIASASRVCAFLTKRGTFAGTKSAERRTRVRSCSQWISAARGSASCGVPQVVSNGFVEDMLDNSHLVQLGDALPRDADLAVDRLVVLPQTTSSPANPAGCLRHAKEDVLHLDLTQIVVRHAHDAV